MTMMKQRVRLLRLDVPTDTTGTVYTKESVERLLDTDLSGAIVPAEFGQPGRSDTARLIRVEPENVCANVSDFKIEGEYLTGVVEPEGPLGWMLTDDEGLSFLLRGLTRTVPNNTDGVGSVRYSISKIIAFDAVFKELKE